MRELRAWFSRLGGLLHKQRRDDELAAEMESHLQMHIDDNLRSGLSAIEARRHALIKLGGVENTKENYRARRGIRSIENMFRDLHYALRMLRKSPGFTAVAVITLALGIGANTAIFSLLNAVVLRTLPVPDPGQLVLLKWTARKYPTRTTTNYSWAGCPSGAHDSAKASISGCSFSYPMFEEMRSEQNVFSGIFAFVSAGQVDASFDGHPHRATGLFVSNNFFSELGVLPATGRVFEPSDEAPGTPTAVVIGYNYWQSQFGKDPSVIGKVLLLNGTPFTVLGVTPQKFFGLETSAPVDIWLPLSSQPVLAPHLPKKTDGNALWLEMGARLRPGVSAMQAEAALSGIYAGSVTNGPNAMFKSADTPHIELPTAARGLDTLRIQFSSPLLVLMIAVAIILLIACANIAGLLLARDAARRKEIAIRFALGASHGRIIRQLLTESLVLACGGGVLGVLLAYWSATSMAAFLSVNSYTPLDIDVRPDLHTLAFTLGISILVGLLFGLAPALRSTRVNVTPALKQSGASFPLGFESRRGLRTGQALIVMQIALSIVMLSGAGLLVRTLVNLETMNIGFDPGNILLFRLDAKRAGYKNNQLERLYRDVQERLVSVPGVTSASYSNVPLLSGMTVMSSFHLQGTSEKSNPAVSYIAVGPGFFETMHMQLLRGRTFTKADFDSEVKPQAMVVNHMFVQQFAGNENVIGRMVTQAGSTDSSSQIVGVIADAKYSGLREKVGPIVYIPFQDGQASFEVRTAGDPRALISLVSSAVNGVNSRIPLLAIKTQTEQIDQTLYKERLMAWLSSLLALLATVLVCVGLYGLLSYEVTCRTQEIGTRMALGAQPSDVLRLVIGQGFMLTVAGIVIGIGVVVGVTRYLQSFLYALRPTDTATLVGVALLLTFVVLVATYVPARRATRIDPMVALRSE